MTRFLKRFFQNDKLCIKNEEGTAIMTRFTSSFDPLLSTLATFAPTLVNTSSLSVTRGCILS